MAEDQVRENLKLVYIEIKSNMLHVVSLLWGIIILIELNIGLFLF